MADYSSYSAGTAYLTIEPRLADDFKGRVEADLQSEKIDFKIPVEPTGIEAFITRVNDEIKAADFKAPVGLDLHLGDFVTKTNDQLKLLDLRAPVELYPDGMAEFKARTQAIGIAQDIRIPVSLDPDFGEFKQRVQAIGTAQDIRIPVVIDPDFDEFKQRTQSTGIAKDIHIPATIDPDFSEFQARIRAIAIARDFRVPVGLDPDFTGFQERLDALAALHNFEIKVRINPDSSGFSKVMSGANGAHSALTAMSAVKMTGIISGVTALAAAVGGLVGLAGGAAAALGAMGAVGLIGSHGLVGAFQARKTATESGGEDAQATEDNRHAALEAVASAQWNLQQAQVGVTNAEREAATAQNTLNEAYKDASRSLRDMNDQLKDAELNQQGAAIAVARARENVNRVNHTAGSTKLDKEEAQYQLDSAEQRYAESKTKTADLRTDNAAAQSKGVAGAPNVVAAQVGLQAAQQNVGDAVHAQAEAAQALADAQHKLEESGKSAGGGQDALAKALEKLAPNARDFYEKMVALGPAWHDLQQAVQNNLFEGLGDSVTKLANDQLPHLKDGFSQLATGLNGGLKATFSSLDETMTRLGNNGTMQAFINGTNSAMSGMAPMVSGLTTAFVQLGAIVGPTLGPLFTSLGSMLSGIAPALGLLGATMANTLTALMPTLTEFISQLGINLAPILPVLGQLLGSLGQALIPLLPVFSQMIQLIGGALGDAINALAPALVPLGQALSSTFAALAPAIGPLGDAISAIVIALAPILPVVGQFVSVLVQALAPAVTTIANAFAPVISTLADALMPVFVQLQPVISQVAGVLADVLAQALTAIVPLITAMAPLFMQLVEALLPLLPPIMDLVMQLLPPLISVFQSLTPVIELVIKMVIDLVNAIVPLLIPIIQQLSIVVSQVFTAIADIISHAVNDIVLPVFGFIDAAIRNVLAPVFHWLFDEVIDPVFRFITGAISFAVRDVIQPTFSVLADGIHGIGDFFTGLGTTVTNIWDGIVSTIAGAVENIGKLLQKVPASVPGIGGWVHGLGDDLVNWGTAHKKATGGYIRGDGGPTDDIIPAMLSNGEYVVNAVATARYGPLLEAINSGQLPGFATGGPVNALQFAKDHPNTPYAWGESSADGADCSGWVGDLQQVAQGVANPTGRLGTTLNVLDGSWPALVDGAAQNDLFIIGANADHMVASIMGTNVEARQTGENVRMGAAAASPFDSQFTKVMHVDPSVFDPAYVADTAAPNASGGNGAGPGVGTSTGADQSNYDASTDATANQAVGDGSGTNTAPTSWSDVAGIAAQAAAKGYVADTLKVFGIQDQKPGWMQGYEAYQAKTISDSAGDAAKGGNTTGKSTTTDPSKSDPSKSSPPPTVPATQDPSKGLTETQQNPFSHVYDPTGGAEQWRGVVEAVLKFGGWNLADADRTVSQIGIESGGDPEATNNSFNDPNNGGVPTGLVQVVPNTYNANKSGGLLDSITDPANNLFAGIHYAIGRYDALDQIWPTKAGYWEGGSVWGDGTPTSDSIPAWLSDREFVMNAKSADANRPLLEAMNQDANVIGNVVAPNLAAAARIRAAAGNQSHVDNSMQVHISTPDVDTAFQKAKTWEAQRGLTYTNRWS